MISGGNLQYGYLKMLADPREEQERIAEAIIALVRLAQRHGMRRGRPC
jgi:hypothetical protein